MGLLEKRNPRATGRSVARWAIGSGVAGFVFALVQLIRTDMPIAAWPFFLIWATGAGALGGALIEWQLDE
jgi:hypothetical protein